MATKILSFRHLMHSRLTLVQKTVFLLMATFALAAGAIGWMTYQHISQVTDQQNTFMAEKMGQQLANLSAPLIVKQDYISLNVTLAELKNQGALVSAAVYDADGQMLAKTGFLNDSNYLIIPIKLNEQALGSLHVRSATVDIQPNLEQLGLLMWPTMGLALLACIILGWWFGAKLVQPLHYLHDAQEQLLEYGKAPRLDDTRLDEWGIINLGFNSINEERLTYTTTDFQYELEMPAGKGVVARDQEEKSDHQPELGEPNSNEEFNHELHNLARELSHEPGLGDLGDPLFAPKLSQALDQENQGMPREGHLPIFTMDDLLQGENSEPLKPSPVAVELVNTVNETAEQEMPVEIAEEVHSQSEEPLVSVLYINVNTRDQGPIAAVEKHMVLESYQGLVDQVCAIYGGAVEISDTKDMVITFDKPHEHMTHCVNALCAAQFFFGLYKAFNQKRAANKKPSLNIQIVVHTGTLAALETLIEEASQLSRRERQDHMVISHHVAYHPDLQQRVLQADNCTPLASGALSLARLTSDYQDLLDMQIDHFSA